MQKLTLLLLAALALSACKKEEEPAKPLSRVKRVVTLSPMHTKWIELDDGARYGMGENLYNRLVTKLQNSGNFVVVVNENWNGIGTQGLKLDTKSLLASAKLQKEYDPSDRLHFEFAPLSAADFNASVEQLTFTHGSRGVKRFAGYSTEFTTPFNNGQFNQQNQNEFTPRSLEFVNGWFGNTFNAIGGSDTGTIAGVDAGEEGEMNLIIASFHYRRDRYLASAKVATELKLIAEQETKRQLLEADGKGFLFALGVGWKQLSVEFGIARKDALKKTFDEAVDRMVNEIQDQLFRIPFRSKIEKYGEEGLILNAGRREGIRVGDIFLHKANGIVTKLKIVESFQIGSRAEWESGNSDLRAGDIVVWDEIASKAVEEAEKNRQKQAELDAQNKKHCQKRFFFGKPKECKQLEAQRATLANAQAKALNLSNNLGIDPGQIPENRKIQGPTNPPLGVVERKSITFDPPEFSLVDDDAAEGLSAKKTILLPYLLWRWSQYDQEVKNDFSGDAPERQEEKARSQWNTALLSTAEAWSLTKGRGVKVAVIDSGVDYNHDNLAARFDRNYAGFDLMSHDYRPFDDNSHGTGIAGIIAAQGGGRKGQVGVAPEAQILSYKAFDPYGATTSAALYGAFQRAIKDGARIIVCAWDTQKDSLALQEALRLAEAHDVLVVAAAGDRGSDLNDSAHFPAVFAKNSPQVISVAALTQKGTLVKIAGRFSNYGVGAVDIAAPGDVMDVLGPRSGILTRAGTDLAAAHVAGVAALVAAQYPEAKGAELKKRILNGARQEANLEVTQGRVLNAYGALLANP